MNRLRFFIDEWIPEDPLYLNPPKPWACPQGWSSHVVTVEINEGQASVSLDRKICNLCSDGLADLEPEYLEAKFRATITGHVEYSLDDVWTWFELTPWPPHPDTPEL